MTLYGTVRGHMTIAQLVAVPRRMFMFGFLALGSRTPLALVDCLLTATSRSLDFLSCPVLDFPYPDLLEIHGNSFPFCWNGSCHTTFAMPRVTNHPKAHRRSNGTSTPHKNSPIKYVRLRFSFIELGN